MNKLYLLPVSLLLAGCRQHEPAPVPAPAAGFYSPDAGIAYFQVSFMNQARNATSFKWSFGDGSTSASEDTTVSHVYTAAGTYQVVLRAYNAQGDSAKTTKSLTVIAPSLVGRYRGTVRSFSWYRTSPLPTTGTITNVTAEAGRSSPQSVVVVTDDGFAVGASLSGVNLQGTGWVGQSPSAPYYQYGKPPSHIQGAFGTYLQREISGDNMYIMWLGPGISAGSGREYFLKNFSVGLAAAGSGRQQLPPLALPITQKLFE